MVTFTNEPFLFVCCLVAGFAMILSWFFGAKAFAQHRPALPTPPEPDTCSAPRDPYRTEEWHTWRHRFNACSCKPTVELTVSNAV